MRNLLTLIIILKLGGFAMCYGMGCDYEDSNGECMKERWVPCPDMYNFDENEYSKAVREAEYARDKAIFSQYEYETGKDIS